MKTLDEEYAEFVARLFAKRHEGADGIMHATVGVAGEVGELLEAIDERDTATIIEELGDLEFYLEAGRQVVGITRAGTVTPPLPMGRPVVYQKDLVIAACQLLDAGKKVWVYAQPIDAMKFIPLFAKVEAQMAAAYYYLAIDREDAILANMEKLQIRYPGGNYSDTLAALRLDKRAA